MPNLRDIRIRIRSIRNTQQITRAMKMVAAARLRRAQEAALASRPYARKLAEVLRSIAARADVSAHPLFRPNGVPLVAVVVISSDRGLCGGFNTNLAKHVVELVKRLEAEGRPVALYPVGRKGRDFFRRRRYATLHERVNVFAKLTFGHAKQLADELVAFFRDGRVGEVVLVYNEFKSVLQPRIVSETFLPIPRLETPGGTAARAGGGAGAPGVAGEDVDYIYEPEPGEILSALVPWHLHTQVYRALLESWAAEQAARMTAMDAATKNAGELIDRLTLNMNKVRQASITREIIEVVSGAMALAK